jgi:UDP-N-acetylglucosamine 3-dehydrogenase
MGYMRKMLPVRIGVIGLGQIALKAHLPGYSKTPDCVLTAVYSKRLDHARAVAVQYGIPHIFTDWKRMLGSKELDAVSVCTPNFTHMPITLTALARGKHVLVEKPMALNRREGQRMLAEARRTRRILMVHHNMRFDPAVRTAKKILDRGTIGAVVAFKTNLTHRGPRAWSRNADWFFDQPKSGGGALMDLGSHPFDTLRFLLGKEGVVKGALAAPSQKRNPKSPEFHCSCLAEFTGGIIGSVTVGWVDAVYHNHFTFYGKKGTLTLNLSKGDSITISRLDKNGKSYPAIAPRDFNPTIYEQFLRCIQEGSVPTPSGKDGMEVLRMIEEGYRFLRR